jgi:predicted ATPase/transcriptional regulator with XRE-family HTH domain
VNPRSVVTFARLLRQHRIEAGLTQAALAEQAGLSTRGIQRLEAGLGQPYAETARRLADGLGLSGEARQQFEVAGRPAPRDRALPRLCPIGSSNQQLARAPAGEPLNGRDVVPPEAKRYLPVPLNTFVGRNEEVAEVRRLLVTTRLLTLTGAGGIGKTRLALEVAQGLIRTYRDGVALAELAGVADPLLVPQLVASALDIQEQPGRPLHQTLIDALRSQQLLLVLDNCEHLVQACAELTELLLRACPELRILATSRQSLRIGGEVAWHVPALGVPSASQALSLEELGQTGAGQLFIDRAHAAAPSFAISEHNAVWIAQICRRLDGIPLALELAAARVPMLGLVQLTERLDDCFRLLTGGSRTALPRQQTLRGTLDWSCSLLTEMERRVFERLAVFVGGWTLAAAEAVSGGEDMPPADVLELLVQLVDKSLVVAEERDGAQRYRLLEPIRQYALERLGTGAKAQSVRRRHAEYFTGLAEAAEAELVGANQAAWLNRLEQEHDNLRAALAWSTGGMGGPLAEQASGRGLRLAAALGMLWHLRGHWREGRQWLEAALTTAPEAPGLLRAKALNAAGWLAWDQGDYERAGALSDEALSLSRELDDLWSIAWSAGRLSHVRWMQVQYAEAAALASEALELFRQLGAPWYIGWALHQLGRVAHAQGDEQRASNLFEESLMHFLASGDRAFGTAFQFANLGDVARVRGDSRRARELYEEALVRFRELGFKQGLVHTLHSLAEVSRADGALTRSRALHGEALLLCRDLGDVPGIAASLEGLAELALSDGCLDRATRLLAGADALRAAVGCPLPPAESRAHEQHLADLCTRLGEIRFQATWRAGRGTSPADAVAYALAEPATDSSRGAGLRHARVQV